jgi:hypothetical protein
MMLQDGNGMMLMDSFWTHFLTEVVHLNHPETSQRRFAPTPDHFTGISGPLHWNTQPFARHAPSLCSTRCDDGSNKLLHN